MRCTAHEIKFLHVSDLASMLREYGIGNELFWGGRVHEPALDRPQITPDNTQVAVWETWEQNEMR